MFLSEDQRQIMAAVNGFSRTNRFYIIKFYNLFSPLDKKLPIIDMSPNLRDKLNKRQSSPTCNSRNQGTKNTLYSASAEYSVLSSGGEGGIRTLDALLTHTRVPVVRHKPG